MGDDLQRSFVTESPTVAPLTSEDFAQLGLLHPLNGRKEIKYMDLLAALDVNSQGMSGTGPVGQGQQVIGRGQNQLAGTATRAAGQRIVGQLIIGQSITRQRIGGGRQRIGGGGQRIAGQTVTREVNVKHGNLVHPTRINQEISVTPSSLIMPTGTVYVNGNVFDSRSIYRQTIQGYKPLSAQDIAKQQQFAGKNTPLRISTPIGQAPSSVINYVGNSLSQNRNVQQNGTVQNGIVQNGLLQNGIVQNGRNDPLAVYEGVNAGSHSQTPLTPSLWQALEHLSRPEYTGTAGTTGAATRQSATRQTVDFESNVPAEEVPELLQRIISSHRLDAKQFANCQLKSFAEVGICENGFQKTSTELESINLTQPCTKVMQFYYDKPCRN